MLSDQFQILSYLSSAQTRRRTGLSSTFRAEQAVSAPKVEIYTPDAHKLYTSKQQNTSHFSCKGFGSRWLEAGGQVIVFQPTLGTPNQRDPGGCAQ